MSGRKGTILEQVYPDLLEKPHIVTKLIDMITDDWQPDATQHEHMVAHLLACSECRTAIILLLSAFHKYERKSHNPEKPAQGLLQKFVALHHEIEAQNHEQMGAYAEMIVDKGRRKADKHFPLFARHVKICSACQATLKETIAFIKEYRHPG